MSLVPAHKVACCFCSFGLDVQTWRPAGTPSSKNHKLNSSQLKPERGFIISISENFRACEASGTAESRCSGSVGTDLSVS